MSDIQTISGESPFDAIRRVRADGSEYWSARDLMPLMGYGTWERFKNPIERALASARNQLGDTAGDFRRSAKNSATKPMEDFELSRFAAYLVAMNGDPNKPEVAAAQHYFAVRTREAESRPAIGNSFDLMRMMVDRLEETDRTARQAIAIAEKTDARLDAMEGRHDWYSALGYARLNGMKNTSTQFLNRVGRQASSIAKSHNISPVKVPHQLFGEVNSYPAWIWELAFTGYEAA